LNYLFSSTTSLDKKDFIDTSNTTFTNQKLPKTNTTHLSRRLSVSSLPIQKEKTLSLRVRQDTKEIPKIPVLSSQSHD
jgi:hypothetical protein